MSKPIRVGLIRCDTHGAYFAPLMTRHDPTLFDQPVPMDQPDDIHYTWMAGGNHYYFYTAYPDPRQMTVPFIEGFDLVKLYDEHRTAAETLARICMGRPQVCDDFEQVSNDVDLVIIADCNYDGSDHGKLATPGIEKGVPTFIDKPLASDTAGVKTILDLARRHRTLVYSQSIIGVLPCIEMFRNRLPEVGNLHFASIEGGGGAMAGHIHSVIFAITTFGSGVQRVWSMGDNPRDIMRLDWGDTPGRPEHGLTITSNVGYTRHGGFFAEVFGPNGRIVSPTISDFEYPFGAAQILRNIRQMLQTRTCPPDLAMMVEAVAITTAAAKAHNTGQAVEVERVSIDDYFKAVSTGD